MCTEKLLAAIAIPVALALAVSAAQAAQPAYPDKPIRLVIGSAPGALSRVVARRQLGASLVLQSRWQEAQAEFDALRAAQISELTREQHKSAQLKEQLDALRAIERTLNERGKGRAK